VLSDEKPVSEQKRSTQSSVVRLVLAPLAVQQKLMRHADIRTTMNIYGDVATDEMEQAQQNRSGWR